MINIFVTVVRIWIIFLAVAFSVVYVLGMEPLYKLLFVLMGLTYGFTAVVEAWVVGLDTGRGKFILILSSMGFTSALAVALNSDLWHVFFRLSILIAVAFMYLNLRFNLHIRLGLSRRIIAIILSILVIITTYLFSRYMQAGAVKEIILWMDSISLILVIANFLMYLGGDIGKVWLAGVIAMLVLLMGDIFFLLGVPGHVELAFWLIPLFIMNNVALRVIQEA